MKSDSGIAVFDDGYAERDWDDGVEGTIRLALVGLGWFSRDEALPAIASGEYATVNAAVSGSKEKAHEVAAEADADAALTYEEFHDGEAINTYDAVYVCTPNARHLEHVEAAAELGKHVICEKPMEATVERAEVLVAACEDAGVTLMVAYRMQADPVIRRIRELVHDGFVGEIAQATGSSTLTMFGEGYTDPDQWRLDPDLAGGGSLYDIGIYPLNTIRFVLDRDPTRVHGSLTSPHTHFEEPTIDEHAAFIAEFDNGIEALCRSSYGAFSEDRLVVSGDEGHIIVENSFDYNASRTVVLEREDRTVRYEDLFANELTEQFDYFAHCCLAGETPHANGEHALVDMHTLAGIQTSAADGYYVDLS